MGFGHFCDNDMDSARHDAVDLPNKCLGNPLEDSDNWTDLQEGEFRDGYL